MFVKSSFLLDGYYKNPKATEENYHKGYFTVGDMARVDEEGYYYIVDRTVDMIISGGENVYPREIEEILYQHPAIQEATVIGIPDPYWVEKIHALVKLKDGERLTDREIVEFCKKKLAGFKAPKSVEFVDTIPKNSMGKILKREIRKKYWTK